MEKLILPESHVKREGWFCDDGTMILPDSFESYSALLKGDYEKELYHLLMHRKYISDLIVLNKDTPNIGNLVDIILQINTDIKHLLML